MSGGLCGMLGLQAFVTPTLLYKQLVLGENERAKNLFREFISSMYPEISVTKSPLDKPLHQLTEDDISQLTREDCRRYLKQKGMRRPSWNKSQAIQQVISLKALLETTDAGKQKKLYISHADNKVQRANTDTEYFELAKATVPDGRKQREKPDFCSDTRAPPVTAVDRSAPSRKIGKVDKPVGQMTIFYSGKVNVYDDVPADKAQAFMCIASSRLSVPSNIPANATVAARHSACCLQAANTKLGPDCDMVLPPTIQTVKMRDESGMHVEESNSLYEDNPEVEE